MDASYLQRFLSESSRNAARNEIRELLKLMARPEIISLAGGMPSPQAFPIDELVELLPAVLAEHGTQALQYGPTEGDAGLVDQLIRMLRLFEGEEFGPLDREHVLVTSASQQGLDLCSRIFLSPGDVVACGLPSYLGALGAFSACGARLAGIPLDDQGLRTDLLEQRLIELRRQGVRPKLVYVVPDFQNPTGVTMSLSRRRDLMTIATDFDLLVVEDSPYRQLRYVGEAPPTLRSIDRDGRVIALFTFSKILSPGLRLGWVVADPEVIARLVVAKQPVDLCSSGLSQVVAREYLAADRIGKQVERIRSLYSGKRETLLGALEEEIDPEWGVSWTRPEGGLFVWLRLPPWMDAGALLEQALERGVAFVAGRAFHCDGSGGSTLRLNFSYPTTTQLRTAVGRLAECIADAQRRTRPPVERIPGLPRVPAGLADGSHALAQLTWNLVVSDIVE